MNTSFQSSAESSYNMLNTVDQGFSNSNIAIIVVICFLIVSVIGIFLIVFMQSRNGKWLGLRLCVKIFIVFICLITLLLSLVMIFICVLTILQDTSCNIIEVMLTSQSPSAQLDGLYTIQDPTRTMLDNGLAEGKDANLSSVLPSIDFSQVQTLLDGISSFQSFKSTFDAQGNTSLTIAPLKDAYTEFLNGKSKNTS